MFHGHLYLPHGSLGIEGFLHNGHEYTYFGLFPSILRMPVLLVTSRLDRTLTAPSMLLSWVVTGVFTSMLLWRLRLMVRGHAILGRAEAASYGLFVAVVGGGSVLIYLAASPFVYNEDFAWSVALTVASLFALLGVLERPSWRRVLAAGFLILLANLNRTPDRLRLRDRRRVGRAVVLAGPGRVRTAPVGGAHARCGRRPLRRQLCRHLRQVRAPGRAAHGRPGMGPCQRPPALLPGRQRRKGIQLRFPPQHRRRLPAASGDPVHRRVPVRHHADRSGGQLRRRGPRPDLSHRQHPADHAAPLPPQLLGRGLDLPATTTRSPGRRRGSSWWPRPPGPPECSSGATSPTATWPISCRSSSWPGASA